MIVVVGGGVSGLSSAFSLLERGHAVEVWSRDATLETTSAVAAAFWYPFRVGPQDRVLTWAKLAYQRFRALAEDPATGVAIVDAFDLSRRGAPRPWWTDAVVGVRAAEASEIPPGFGSAWVFPAPVIDTRVYLPWLAQQVKAAGGRIVSRTIARLDEALARTPRVVHCAGLGARELVGDRSLVPVRGQLVYAANPGVTRVLLDEHDGDRIAYVVPRGDQVVLGGSATEHDERLTADHGEAEAIVQACGSLEPRVRAATRVGDGVGLRPWRPAVRVEAESFGDGRVVVHNYGHGGAGITLSWGCANEVADLVGDPA